MICLFIMIQVLQRFGDKNILNVPLYILDPKNLKIYLGISNKFLEH